MRLVNRSYEILLFREGSLSDSVINSTLLAIGNGEEQGDM